MNTFICYDRCTTCKKVLVGFKESEWEEKVL